MNVLYHYCSTESFVSIISNKCIRLSSLTLSNDRKEGELIQDILLQIARDANLMPSVVARFERALRNSYEFFDGLGFCLSENGDLLSQWRGYADDGKGLSIGFNRKYLKALSERRKEADTPSYHLCKLVYDKRGQRRIAEKHFEKLRPLINDGAFRNPTGTLLAPTDGDERERIEKSTRAAYFAIALAMLQMFEIKHPAFKEEREWRMVNFSFREFLDDKGIKFRPAGDKIVPFRELELEDVGVRPIAKVILGPKHQGPEHAVHRLLALSGFSKVKVIKSVATYR